MSGWERKYSELSCKSRHRPGTGRGEGRRTHKSTNQETSKRTNRKRSKGTLQDTHSLQELVPPLCKGEGKSRISHEKEGRRGRDSGTSNKF